MVSSRPDTSRLWGRFEYAFGEFRSWEGYWVASFAILAAVTAVSVGLVPDQLSRILLRAISFAGATLVFHRGVRIRQGRIPEFVDRARPKTVEWALFLVAVALLLLVLAANAFERRV